MPLAASDERRILHPIQRDAAVFVETVAESGGERTVLDIELAPGGGNRRHTHRTFAETFTAVEGELTVRVGDRMLRLRPGETATAPPRTSHRVANETAETVHFRVELRPGHRGLEQSLQIAYGLAADGLTHPDGLPKSVLHLALLLGWPDTRGGGIGRVVAEVLRPLAAIARRKGIDRQLAERYCRH